jgi:hypothetical protein
VIADHCDSRSKERSARFTQTMRATVVFCALACVAPDCGGGRATGDPGDDAPPSSGCPLSSPAQQLLLQLVTQAETSLNAALSKGGPEDLSVQFGLLGLGTMEGSDVQLAMPCVAPTTSGVTCGSDLASSPLAPGLDTCFQTGCEAAAIPYVNVYVTQTPHRAPGDRVDITYAMASPYSPGQVSYRPNPLTYWRYDASSAGLLMVSADLSNTISVTLASGTVLDFSYSGHLEGTQNTNTEYTETLRFPNLSPSGPVSVSLANSSVAPRSGTVSIGSTTLATLSQGGVAWEGACR